MAMKNPPHVGRVIWHGIIEPLDLSVTKVAEILGVRRATLSDLINGKTALTAEMVERAITPRTKLIILNSPSNPSGRVIPPGDFKEIMEVVAEKDIYAVSDECYLRFVYPPATVFSAAINWPPSWSPEGSPATSMRWSGLVAGTLMRRRPRRRGRACRRRRRQPACPGRARCAPRPRCRITGDLEPHLCVAGFELGG